MTYKIIPCTGFKKQRVQHDMTCSKGQIGVTLYQLVEGAPLVQQRVLSMEDQSTTFSTLMESQSSTKKCAKNLREA